MLLNFYIIRKRLKHCFTIKRPNWHNNGTGWIMIFIQYVKCRGNVVGWLFDCIIWKKLWITCLESCVLTDGMAICHCFVCDWLCCLMHTIMHLGCWYVLMLRWDHWVYRRFYMRFLLINISYNTNFSLLTTELSGRRILS